MKKNIFRTLSLAVFILSACGGNASVPNKPTAVPVMDASATPSQIPTTTWTTYSTDTPFPATRTIAPLPTIPTFTPTFDVRSIITATLASKEECPKIASIANPDMSFMDFSYDKIDNKKNAETNILNFLNKYGPEPILNELRGGWKTEGIHFAYKDFTNDGVSELALGAVAFYIFGCQNGQYVNLFELPPDGYGRPPSIFSIQDNNHNGILELTILIGVWSQGGRAYHIYEWNGAEFRNIIMAENPNYPDWAEIWVEATGNIHYEDVNHDFINELILDSGIPVWSTYVDGLPWRNKRSIYQWNGKNYLPTHHEFAPPEFKFQAVQDGDLATSQFEYNKALSLYQDVIFNSKLKDYSPDIQRNLQENWISLRREGIKVTPTPFPPDPSEYPKLAAYAYYRIMLLHFVRGYESDAGTVYNTLQQKFGADPNGRPYAEMATAFWGAYQSAHSVYDACAAAIQYADEHRAILIPLGSDYHGAQSHSYVPADVCPFR